MTQFLYVNGRQIATSERVKLSEKEKELARWNTLSKDEPVAVKMTRQEMIKAYKDKFWEAPERTIKNVELEAKLKE